MCLKLRTGDADRESMTSTTSDYNAPTAINAWTLASVHVVLYYAQSLIVLASCSMTFTLSTELPDGILSGCSLQT